MGRKRPTLAYVNPRREALRHFAIPDRETPARLARPRRRRRGLVLAFVVAALLLAGLPTLTAAPAPRAAADGSSGCRVASVTDGDTVRLDCGGGTTIPARLIGFDAPELFSPACPAERALALRAKGRLRALLPPGGTATFVREGTDRYGRAIVRAWSGGLPVADRMIADGHGRPYEGGRRAGWCA